MREEVQKNRTALYLCSMPNWKDRTKVNLGCTDIVLARLVYHYDYLNSITNELWQDCNNRLFKRCASCQPYLYHFAWQSVPSLILCSSNGKNRFLGRSPGQILTSRQSSWFFHRHWETSMLAGFSIPDIQSPLTQRKFSKGFHQGSRSLFHNMPAKPPRLESSSIDFFFLFFFPPTINVPIALASGYLQKCSLSTLTVKNIQESFVVKVEDKLI